jgi:predicted amidohydrolase
MKYSRGKTMRVAGYQMLVQNDIQFNCRKIIAAIDRAVEEHAEILLTPEGSLSGYTHKFDTDVAAAALAEVTSHAREKKIGLALGTCFVEEDGLCYNQIRFYQPDGTYLGYHSKTLNCSNLADPPKGEINHYSVKPLSVFTWGKNIPIAGLICNDMWANPQCTSMPDPHLCQQLSRMGAKVVFHAVNGGRDGSDWSRLVWNYHESNLRMRASAGRVWIVTVDNADPPHIPCAAPSGVINPSGQFVYQAPPKGEHLFSWDIAEL